LTVGAPTHGFVRLISQRIVCWPGPVARAAGITTCTIISLLAAMVTVGDGLGLLWDASAFDVGAQPLVRVVDRPRFVAELAVLAALRHVYLFVCRVARIAILVYVAVLTSALGPGRVPLAEVVGRVAVGAFSAVISALSRPKASTCTQVLDLYIICGLTSVRPELQVGERCLDGPNALFIATVTLHPPGARRPPAADNEGHS